MVGSVSKRLVVFVLLYLFVSFAFFTVFMGVPVFNVAVGFFGALYLSKRKAKELSTSQYRLFSLVVLLGTFVGSAYYALTDTHTAANLEGMFSLNFSVTLLHIWALILLGGALFLFINDLVIRKTLNRKRAIA